MSNTTNPQPDIGPAKGEDDEVLDELTSTLDNERRKAVDTIDRPSE